MDLFGDLPEPSSNCGLSTNCEKKDVEKEESKRKLPHSDSFPSDDEPANKKVNTGILNLRGYHAESKGERDEMQDAFVIIDNFKTVLPVSTNCGSLAYYGVFDGHGGAKASEYAATHLHKNIASRFPQGDIDQVEADMRKCFIESYKKTDEDFLKEATKVKPAWKDGTTALSVLAINNTLYIANLGDSKAVLCRYNEESEKYTAIPLTTDHSPVQFSERMRIQKAGGHVKEGRVMGVLEVSRSIGDGRYKKHGVSCLPDVKRCQLTPQDRFVLIACDGLWKAFTPEAAIDLTNKVLKDESIEASELRTAEDMRWDSACIRLVAESVRRLSADNVTVLLVNISQTSNS